MDDDTVALKGGKKRADLILAALHIISVIVVHDCCCASLVCLIEIVWQSELLLLRQVCDLCNPNYK